MQGEGGWGIEFMRKKCMFIHVLNKNNLTTHKYIIDKTAFLNFLSFLLVLFSIFLNSFLNFSILFSIKGGYTSSPPIISVHKILDRSLVTQGSCLSHKATKPLVPLDDTFKTEVTRTFLNGT